MDVKFPKRGSICLWLLQISAISKSDKRNGMSCHGLSTAERVTCCYSLCPCSLLRHLHGERVYKIGLSLKS